MAEQKELEPYQQRVVEEKDELDGKITRLWGFMISVEFLSLKPVDRDLLEQQLHTMLAYSRILRFRIINFQGGDNA